MIKLTTRALAETAVVMMKTESKPFIYDDKMALFWGESAIVRRTKIYCSES